MKIAKIGGPTYKIGMNGGSASSRVSKQSNQFLDENAVQREIDARYGGAANRKAGRGLGT